MTNKFYIVLSQQKSVSSYAVLKFTDNLTYEVKTGDIPYIENEAYEILTKQLVLDNKARNYIFKYQSKEIASHMGNVFHNDEFYKGLRIMATPALFPNDIVKQNKAFGLLGSYIAMKHYVQHNRFNIEKYNI